MSRILLDQNVPRALGRLLSRHDVRTAADLGWGELTNGELLSAAVGDGFDVMITCDQNIRHQQNMRNIRLGVVVLSTNHWATLQASAVRIVAAVDASQPSNLTIVECGLPPKRRNPSPRLRS